MRIKVIAIVASLFASDLWSGPYQANMPIEIYQGPIFSNSKILGMGGASIGVAEGAGAQSTNPAALANRIIYDELSNFDWDVLFEYLVDISAETKIENNGRDTNPADKIDLTSMGGLIQYKKWGYGLVANGLTHEMCVEESASDCSDPNKNVHFSAVNAYLGAGKSFSKGKYLFGANLVGSYIDLGTKKNVDLVSLSGVGLQLGFLWKDPDKNYRLGMSLRSPVNVRADSESNKNKVLGLQAPQKTSLPWNIGFGFSYYWGARQFNKRQDFSKRSSYLKEQKLPRRYYLLAADLVVVGIQKNAVGIESWLLQEDQSAGDFLGLSPRVGFETEFWPNRLKGRIGTYREPSRFHDVDGRLHGTFGFDLRLFRLWDWDLQLTSAFDFSNQYQNLIVSIFSFWH